ncbi:MAG: hypothetical protein AUI14_13795 [Actinobacteria bacterium 13_2_20CM_2_71_6]|nr:MAG: hypothetical protein AUI14_13795 [Actinobacteria bacterium 13_2_20CM_2_71_6]
MQPGSAGRSDRAARARERAESALRRAEKQRQHGDRLCVREQGFLPKQAQLLEHLVYRTFAQRTRTDLLCAEAAEVSANSCDQVACAHERLARAGSGDVAAHQRQAEECRLVAVVLREAAAWFRDAAGWSTDG